MVNMPLMSRMLSHDEHFSMKYFPMMLISERYHTNTLALCWSNKHQQVNPYAAGGQFCQHKMMQKSGKHDVNPGTLGTHRRVLSESCPTNTNTTRFEWSSKNFAS